MSNRIVLSQSQKLLLESESLPTGIKFYFAGVIDEDVNLSIILHQIAALKNLPNEVHFDTGRVTRINSAGVREWILMMEYLGDKSFFFFVDVSDVFMEQANMIPNLLGGKKSRIVSFQAPYHCSVCTEASTHSLLPREVLRTSDGNYIAPEQHCKRCHSKLDFDWLEEEYFGILSRIGRE